MEPLMIVTLLAIGLALFFALQALGEGLGGQHHEREEESVALPTLLVYLAIGVAICLHAFARGGIEE